LSVEFIHVSRGKEALKRFMKKQGYIEAATVKHKFKLANDFVFLHKTLAHLMKNGQGNADLKLPRLSVVKFNDKVEID
jgi:hypothetical protein